MCGRYNVKRQAEDAAKELGTVLPPGILEAGLLPLGPRFNILPTTQVLVVRADASGARVAVSLRWGLIPGKTKTLKKGGPMTIARADTIAELWSFRSSFKRRRCLIPADGYYEWKTDGKLKTPFEVSMADDSLFCFAGIWDSWLGPDLKNPESNTIIDSVAMITTEANALTAQIEERMPVILPREFYDGWLDPDLQDPEALQPMLSIYPTELMKAQEVHKEIGKVKFHDDPRYPASKLVFQKGQPATLKPEGLF